LTALGRSFRENPRLEEPAALKEGAHQFKITYEQLRLRLQDQWAKEHCLVAVAGSQRDGSSGVRTEDGSFVARRRSIERLADIVFSSNPAQATYWLGRGVDTTETIQSMFGGPKPCMHGSDSHTSESLGEPKALGRYTWIKGNTPFDALRMACIAPEFRVHVGPQAPSSGQTYGRMDRVGVSDSSWFTNGAIPLNTGLIAVIGPRGSGKTALADVIAIGAGARTPFENQRSFVNRAHHLLANASVEVSWTHGAKTTAALDGSDKGDPADRGVRYLSQQFVDQLCAADGVTDELLEEVERVVFAAWPPGQRQGATTFRELLEIRLAAARVRQRSNLDSVTRTSDMIAERHARVRDLPGFRRQLGDQENLLKDLTAQVAELTATAEVGSVERLSAVRSVLFERETAMQGIERRQTDLGALSRAVEAARSGAFPRFREGLRDRHRAAGVADADWEQFSINFVGPVEDILAAATQMATEEYALVAGVEVTSDEPINFDGDDIEALRARPVSQLRAERDRLQKLVGLDDHRTRRLRLLDEQANSVRARAAKLRSSIDAVLIGQEETPRLIEERLTSYGEYFDGVHSGVGSDLGMYMIKI
jgi:hypothetical protein